MISSDLKIQLFKLIICGSKVEWVFSVFMHKQNSTLSLHQNYKKFVVVVVVVLLCDQ